MSLPSVTEILSKYQDWSSVPDKYLASAIERGKAVHAYAAAYCNDLFSPIPQEYKGYCQSLRNWKDRYVTKVVAVEKELASKTYHYIGHLDLIAEIEGKWLAVIDWKTPYAKSRMWAAQVAAYRQLAIENGYDIRKIGSVRLRADGGPAIFDDYSTSKDDFRAFLSALYAHRYFVKG